MYFTVVIGGSKEGLGTCPLSNFFHFHAVFGKNLVKQECIPVGCIPPTAVAISPAMHAPLMHAPHHAPPATHAHPAMHAPLHHAHPLHHVCPLHHACPPFPCVPPPPFAMYTPRTEFLTHACENIAFPQPLLRTVKIGFCLKLSS